MHPMNSKLMNSKHLIWIAIAAVVMAGCQGGAGGSSNLTDYQKAQRDELAKIQKIQTEIAEKKKVSKYEVSAKDIQDDPRAKEMKLDDQMGLQKIQQALAMDLDDLPALKDFSGYKKIDWKNPDERLKGYSTNKRIPEAASPNMPAQGYEPFIDRFKDAKIVVMDLKVTTTSPPPAVEKGEEPPPPEKNTMEITFGPIEEKEADRLIEQAKKAGTEVEKVKTYPASFYIGPKGKIAIAVEGLKDVSRLQPPRDLQYYMVSVDTMKKLEEARQKDPTIQMVPPKQFDIAIIGYKG